MGKAVYDQPDAHQTGKEHRPKHQKSKRKESETGKYFVDQEAMIMNTQKEHCATKIQLSPASRSVTIPARNINSCVAMFLAVAVALSRTINLPVK